MRASRGALASGQVDVYAMSSLARSMARITTNPSGDGDEINCHTPAPTVPPSPHLSINRSAYNLAEFNKKFDAIETQNQSPLNKLHKWAQQQCSAAAWSKRIPRIFPWTEWLLNYEWKNDLVADLIVGLTVAIFQVPQSMGYCLIAHVPPVHGLYTAFFPPLIYAFFGTSRHSAVGELSVLADEITTGLITGAFAIVSGVMTGNLVVQIMQENGYPIDFLNNHDPDSATDSSLEATVNPVKVPEHHDLEHLQTIEIATAVTMWMGVYMLFFGTFQLGFISIYLSEQLISGFASAASIYVFTSQLRYLLGVDFAYRSGFLAIVYSYVDVFVRWKEINITAVTISAICILILLFFKTFVNAKLRDFGINVPFPIELFVVIGGTAASHLLDLQKRVHIVGTIRQGLPSPQLPRLDVFKSVWIRAIPLAAGELSVLIL